MGLNISHDAWNGPYSKFMAWRKDIGKTLDIPLMLMEGFYGGGIGSIADIVNKIPLKSHEDIYRDILIDFHRLLPLKWESLKSDPLHVLLKHSDCDGEIEVSDLEPIAIRLEEIMPILSDWHEETQQFIKGCRLAVSQNEPLVFC